MAKVRSTINQGDGKIILPYLDKPVVFDEDGITEVPDDVVEDLVEAVDALEIVGDTKVKKATKKTTTAKKEAKATAPAKAEETPKAEDQGSGDDAGPSETVKATTTEDAGDKVADLVTRIKEEMTLSELQALAAQAADESVWGDMDEAKLRTFLLNKLK